MHAFGLEVDGDPLPDLVAGPAPARRVTLELVDRDAEAARRWGGAPGAGDGLVVRQDDGTGWLVSAPGLGTHVLAPDGTRLVAHVPTTRLLHAQTLPLAATLQGLEVLHAGAVALDGRVVALVAGAGTGKSSVTAHLVARGATFVTDDALALEPRDGGMLAHPGPRVLGVPAHEGLDLGPVRAAEPDKLLVEPRAGGASAPLPLAAVLVLDRRAPHDALALLPVEQPVALLLAATFVPYVTAPGRQARLLATASDLAAGIAVRRLTVRPEDAAADVADAVLRAHREGTFG